MEGKGTRSGNKEISRAQGSRYGPPAGPDVLANHGFQIESGIIEFPFLRASNAPVF